MGGLYSVEKVPCSSRRKSFASRGDDLNSADIYLVTAAGLGSASPTCKIALILLRHTRSFFVEFYVVVVLLMPINQTVVSFLHPSERWA